MWRVPLLLPARSRQSRDAGGAEGRGGRSSGKRRCARAGPDAAATSEADAVPEAGVGPEPGWPGVRGGPGAGVAHGVVATTVDGLRLIEVDWSKCDDCGLCAEQCPAGALSMWGRRYTVSEVVDRVVRDRPFFEKSGGGVTVSGGEPFSQPEFTLALLRAFKERGIHTALDTTGLASWGIIEQALPYVDLFLLDLKNMDSPEHKAVTGVPNEPILDNARRIAAAGGKMQIRIPVIPRFNDSDEDFEQVGRFVKELGGAVTLVQLLPYHALGVPKLERIRHDGPILEATAPSDERMGELKAILEEYGLTVQVH